MHIRLLTVIFTLFMLPACMTQADKQQDSDTLLHQLHQTMQMQQWEQAAKLYDPSFFQNQPQYAWKKNMQDLQQSLGKMVSFHVSSKSKDPRFSGDFYIYIVSIEHEHGFSNETVTILKKIDSDQLSIAGHQIKARSKN